MITKNLGLRDRTVLMLIIALCFNPSLSAVCLIMKIKATTLNWAALNKTEKAESDNESYSNVWLEWWPELLLLWNKIVEKNYNKLMTFLTKVTEKCSNKKLKTRFKQESINKMS